MIRRADPAGGATLLDRAIGYFSPLRGARRAAARRAMALSANFRGASTSRLRNDWILPGQESGANPGWYELAALRARSRDANRNDPIAAGATETMRANIVGNGLKPQSKIRGERLGLSDERAAILRFQAEAAWQRWTPLADAANVLTFDELQFLAITKIIEDGEVIALPTWANEPWRPFGRCLQLLESERLSDQGRGRGVMDGITFGDRGQPITYHLYDPQKKSINHLAARDDRGRPMVLHVFPTRRPGQRRGIPVFAPVLTYFLDLARYVEAEVVAARVSACLGVFITKTDAMGAAVAYGSETESSGSRIQGLEPAMLSYLEPGESINVVDPKRPGDTFAPFVEQILRMIGAGLGLPYELIAKDFSKTNYSSARASLLEGRRVFTHWRGWFSQRFCQPIWDLVLEEAYLRGEFTAPDFYKYQQEYCRALWVGGSWGWVDPVKEVEASRKAIDYGLSTIAEEAAGQGRDWEEIVEQRAREERKIADAGLLVSRSAKGDVNAQTQEEN